MLEKLTRYFKAAYALRRSERAFIRDGAAMELEELRREVAHHPKLTSRINAALNSHITAKSA